MPDTGYYSGLLEGMQGVSGMQHQGAQTQLLKEEIPTNRLEFQALQQQLKDQVIQRNLMKQAFQAGSGMRAGADEQQNLEMNTSKLYQLGRGLMASGQLKQGMEVLKEADASKRSAILNRASTISANKAQAEVIGGIYASVGDQASLDAAIPELAKNGKVWPEDMRNWDDPNTQEYVAKQERASKIGQGAAGLDLNAIRTQAGLDRDADNKKSRENLLKYRAAKDQLARDALAGKGKPYAEMSSDKLITAIGIHSANKDFARLDLPEKEKATDDIARLSWQLIRDEKLSPGAAQTKAEEMAFDRIKDGKYLGMKDIFEGTAKDVGKGIHGTPVGTTQMAEDGQMYIFDKAGADDYKKENWRLARQQSGTID
jgi:hypothetical protein